MHAICLLPVGRSNVLFNYDLFQTVLLVKARHFLFKSNAINGIDYLQVCDPAISKRPKTTSHLLTEATESYTSKLRFSGSFATFRLVYRMSRYEHIAFFYVFMLCSIKTNSFLPATSAQKELAWLLGVLISESVDFTKMMFTSTSSRLQFREGALLIQKGHFSNSFLR